MEHASARRAGLPPQRPGEDPAATRTRLLRPTGDAARDALAHGWADHVQGRASWQDWRKLADLCNPRQCMLTPPGEPVPLMLSADGARGFYLLGLAGLDGPELSRESLRDAVFFLSQTGPGRTIVQDLVPGYYLEADIPPDNLRWLVARELWAPGSAEALDARPSPGDEAPAALPSPPASPDAHTSADPQGAAGTEDEQDGEDEPLSPSDPPEPEPQGLALPCSVCGHLPGSWHKCCPVCSVSAEGEQDVDRIFGFRTLRGKRSPQTWCRRCRAGQGAPPEQLALAV